MVDISFTQDELVHLAKLIRCSGDTGFPDLLREFMRRRMRFSTFLIVSYRSNHPPLPVYHWIPDPQLRAIYMTQYIKGAFLLDPYYQLSNQSFGPTAHRLRDFAPDRFFASEYFQQYYSATGLIDEVGFLVRISDGKVGHLSMSRSKTDKLFTRQELQALEAFAPVICELLHRHCAWSDRQAEPARDQFTVRRSLDLIIHDYARDLLAGVLTRREAEVTALILQGHSSSSASMVLGISRETAKVHLRNIYRKLGISSQAQLFATFGSALGQAAAFDGGRPIPPAG